MKTLLIPLALLLATSPAAAASTLLEDDAAIGAEPLALSLETSAPSIQAGYTGELLAQGSEAGERMYSPAKEGGMSFLLPGLGQHRMGYSTRAKIYFALEGINWIICGTSLIQGYSREQEYEEYAVVYAGVSGTGHSSDYYSTVGEYISNEGPGGYNESVRWDARDLYYPDTEAMDSYYEANAITGSMSWRWRTVDAFNNYNELYDGSRSAYRRALYCVMFAVSLRVVSGVDAIFLARKSDKAPVDKQSGVSIGVEPKPGGFALSVSGSF
jgi:hypothetical protein